MLTCNFHRDWKYLSIISSLLAYFWSVCKIVVSSYHAARVLKVTAYSVIIIPEIVTGHRMHSDQTRGGHVTRARVCLKSLNITKKMRVARKSRHSLLSDALWYLGFSGTRDKWWGDQIVTSLTTLCFFSKWWQNCSFISLEILCLARGEDKNLIRLGGWGWCLYIKVFRTSGDQT